MPLVYCSIICESIISYFHVYLPANGFTALRKPALLKHVMSFPIVSQCELPAINVHSAKCRSMLAKQISMSHHRSYYTICPDELNNAGFYSLRGLCSVEPCWSNSKNCARAPRPVHRQPPAPPIGHLDTV